MAWCPNCGDGYREDAKVCGWCGEALIPGPMPRQEPEPRTGQFAGWQQLCKVRATAQIALVTGVLEGADIPYMTWDRGAGQYLRIVMGLNAFGQEIYVPEDRLSQARELLRAYCQAWPTAMIFQDDPAALAAAAERDELEDPEALPYPDEPAFSEEPAQGQAEAYRLLPGLLLGLYWVIALLALAGGRVSTAAAAVLLAVGAAGTIWFFRKKS